MWKLILVTLMIGPQGGVERVENTFKFANEAQCREAIDKIKADPEEAQPGYRIEHQFDCKAPEVTEAKADEANTAPVQTSGQTPGAPSVQNADGLQKPKTGRAKSHRKPLPPKARSVPSKATVMIARAPARKRSQPASVAPERPRVQQASVAPQPAASHSFFAFLFR